MNRATWCGRVGALCSLVMLVSPPAVPAQELTFGFFDATVTVPTAGTTSYPGWSVGGSMPIAAGGRVSVYGVYNRDYGSQQKPTHDAVPSLQFGASVRVASAGNFRAYLRAGAIRAYLGHTTLTTPLIGVGARHGGRYGIAASLDYGTAREVTTVASMVGFYLGF